MSRAVHKSNKLKNAINSQAFYHLLWQYKREANLEKAPTSQAISPLERYADGGVVGQGSSGTSHWEGAPQKAPEVLWTQGLKRRTVRRAESGKVLSQVDKKYLQGSPPWPAKVVLAEASQECVCWRLLRKRPLDKGTRLGMQLGKLCTRLYRPVRGAWVLTATPFRDYSAVAGPPVCFGEGSFAPWALPRKAFIIAHGWAWKITHSFLTRIWTTQLFHPYSVLYL